MHSILDTVKTISKVFEGKSLEDESVNYDSCDSRDTHEDELVAVTNAAINARLESEDRYGSQLPDWSPHLHWNFNF